MVAWLPSQRPPENRPTGGIPGSGNNLLIHATFHITVNANGQVTAIVDNFSDECQ